MGLDLRLQRGHDRVRGPASRVRSAST
jgi:hypothetical protein